MAENFGLVRKSLRSKLGRRSYFTPEGKVALMFLKMYTGLSCPKLMEQLNGNIHYQMFCDVIISPKRPLTNYKLLDDIMMELAGKLKIQQQQDLLAEMWKPYMKDLDTMYTDATCYESEMRYPTDPKLLWEGIEKSYRIMTDHFTFYKCLKNKSWQSTKQKQHSPESSTFHATSEQQNVQIVATMQQMQLSSK